MTPRTQALAYRIWSYATPRAWDLTAYDIAEALEVEVARVHYILAEKGWNARTRNSRTEPIYATIGLAQRPRTDHHVSVALAYYAPRRANRIPLEG